MCLHCKTKRNCTSLNCVLRSTKKPDSTCNLGSNSLKISKDIFNGQTDEVKKTVLKLRKEENKARRGYRLFIAHNNSIRREPLAASINEDKALATEQREAKERATELPETKFEFDFKKKSLPAKELTDLHFKQIQLYEKIEKDLKRLKIAREERAKAAAIRRDSEAEKDELREKLKEKAEIKSSVPSKSSELKADKRAERKERALAKKQREQEAKAEIKLNQQNFKALLIKNDRISGNNMEIQIC